MDKQINKEKLLVTADGSGLNEEATSARPQTIFVDNCSLKPKKKIKRAQWASQTTQFETVDDNRLSLKSKRSNIKTKKCNRVPSKENNVQPYSSDLVKVPLETTQKSTNYNLKAQSILSLVTLERA